MRRIERATQFKRDFKRERRGPHQEALQTTFVEVVSALPMTKASLSAIETTP